MFRGNAKIVFFWGGGTSDKISYMISLKSCTAMASPKFRFGRTFSKNAPIKDLKKILNFLKNLHKNLIHSPNYIKNKI